MITLRDTIEIKAHPSELFDWFSDLPRHYRAWHPDHVLCRFEGSKTLGPGARLYAEEILHGKLHKLHFTITDVRHPSRVGYRIAPGLRGSFIAQESGNGTLFTAEIDLGFEFPILGAMVDRLLRAFFTPIISVVEEHMKEEGVNLKHIMEAR